MSSTHSRIAVLIPFFVTLLCGCAAQQSLTLIGLAGQAAIKGAQYMVPSSSSNTVHFGAAIPPEVCIEFNPDTQVPDFIPALQAELKERGVKSRVLDRGTVNNECKVWVRYLAVIAWGIPSTDDHYRPYLSNASLYMVEANGRLMSASHFEIHWPIGLGQWASTRKKLSPVVYSLLTGFKSS